MFFKECNQNILRTELNQRGLATKRDSWSPMIEYSSRDVDTSQDGAPKFLDMQDPMEITSE